MKTLPLTDWITIANEVLPSVETDLENKSMLSYIKDIVMMGTTEVCQLQIPRNGYFRDGTKAEFPTSEGASLVPTDGDSSAFDTSVNADILYQFVFEYDGKKEFDYQKEAE
jgi:hypothetical protein